MLTVVVEFLAIECPSAFNWVIGRPLLKALKVITSIRCLTIKFPTAARIGKYKGISGTQGSATIGHSS